MLTDFARQEHRTRDFARLSTKADKAADVYDELGDRPAMPSRTAGAQSADSGLWGSFVGKIQEVHEQISNYAPVVAPLYRSLYDNIKTEFKEQNSKALSTIWIVALFSLLPGLACHGEDVRWPTP